MKKFLTLLLTVAMVLSLMAVSASAEELTAASHHTADAACEAAEQIADIASGINEQSNSAAGADRTAMDMERFKV